MPPARTETTASISRWDTPTDRREGNGLNPRLPGFIGAEYAVAVRLSFVLHGIAPAAGTHARNRLEASPGRQARGRGSDLQRYSQKGSKEPRRASLPGTARAPGRKAR